jgi:hypothetical protein
MQAERAEIEDVSALSHPSEGSPRGERETL